MELCIAYDYHLNTFEISDELAVKLKDMLNPDEINETVINEGVLILEDETPDSVMYDYVAALEAYEHGYYDDIREEFNRYIDEELDNR